MKDKRTQLINAATDLFAREGFWNTSTARIAKHAGVATGTLFNYFASKEALIDAVYVEIKTRVAEAILPGLPDLNDTSACFNHFWRTYIRWGVDNPIEHNLLQQMKLANMASHDVKAELDQQFAVMGRLLERFSRLDSTVVVPLPYMVELIFAQLEVAIDSAISDNLTGAALQQHIDTGFAIAMRGLTVN
ncbi:TetR/AcrR family transcriptional regulator [Reinekea sp.]|jgi:AcrR family transcriptional regulator|uniref:TetR/AcrR family transcriptional regulator n=1 Tax=Reinekea sp. TaxID=1970455 RepID=UPI002A82013F|nr:TetR/AcrR family transcriptional regulator [Reinekea sp.]